MWGRDRCGDGVERGRWRGCWSFGGMSGCVSEWVGLSCAGLGMKGEVVEETEH